MPRSASTLHFRTGSVVRRAISAWGAAFLFSVAAACSATAKSVPDRPRELEPEGLDPTPGSMAGPLDQWGDWLRGARHWRLDRRVLEKTGPAGFRAVRTEARPVASVDAGKRGWFVTGFTVDGTEWAGARGVRFYCRTDHPGRVRLLLYATDSIWHLDRVVAETAISASTVWTEYRLSVGKFRATKSARPDWRRVRAVGWVIEGAPNAIELAGFRLLLTDTTVRRVLGARLRRRLDQLRLDTHSLAGRGLSIPYLAEFADRAAAHLSNGKPPTDAELDAATALLEQAETVRAAGDTLFSIRQRLAHCRDYLAVLDGATSAPLREKRAGLDRQRGCIARELRTLRASTSPESVGPRVSALEQNCNELWKSLRALTIIDPARFRPTVRSGWWRRAGGRPIVPLAAHVLHTIYGNEKGWRRPREADYRLISTWGFNATRVEVRYALLEPERGRFDPDYLNLLHNVIEWADKYGLYAVIDMHWPYPDWFYKGQAKAPCPNREEQNPYHQPDALVSTFRRLARELNVHPNILAWEVPTNEPAISSIEIWPNPKNDPTIADIPALMHSWNRWLREKYGTRSRLDRMWRNTPYMPDKNGLGLTETWETDSILPPGKRGVPARWNRRLYDYLEWAVEMHTTLCQRVAAAIRESIPGAVVQQQPPAGGGRWERDPIPVVYFPWQQIHAPGVQVGTHYGVGHACAWISPLDMPSMNSEERTEWRKGIFARHRARNQGATAFVYFPKNGFINRDFRLKPSTAWLAAASEFWDRAECRIERPVLVIVNSRLAALRTGQDGSTVIPLLERLGIGYDVAGSAYVAGTPDLIRRYRAVTMSLDYADPACIAAVHGAGVPAWMFGCPGPDVRAGFGENSVPACLARLKLFLRKVPAPKDASARAEAVPDYLDLSGTWRFRTDPNDIGKTGGWWKVAADDRTWEDQAVPAYWENVGVLHKGRNYDGVAWYRRRVRVPRGWTGRELLLEFGAIDDLDETYVNGKLVGSTDETVYHYWEAFRRYPIAAGILRPEEDNVIAVRVRDLRGNGGIWRAPVRLRLAESRRIRFTRGFGAGLLGIGDSVASNVSARMPVVTRPMLAAGVRVSAEFVTDHDSSPDGRPVALLSQDRCRLWLGADTLDSNDADALKLLAGFLREAGLSVSYPPPKELDGIKVYRFEPDWIAVVNESRQLRPVVLPTRRLVTDLEGYPLTQTVQPSGRVRVLVRGDHPSSALFLRSHDVRLRPTGEKPVAVESFSETRLPRGTDIRLTTRSVGPVVVQLGPLPAGGMADIDGMRRDLPRSKGLLLPVPPGEHTIRVVRHELSGE